ncbi:MAG: hypothetical protein NTV49_12890, partial [Kiritimatiellaeota bacterium]|nr:hypothetical protein [Kiritimatiellota bacterium]
TVSVARDAKERADLIPPNIEDFNRRFDTALLTGAMETEGGVRAALDAVRKKTMEKGKIALGRLHGANGGGKGGPLDEPQNAPESALAEMVVDRAPMVADAPAAPPRADAATSCGNAPRDGTAVLTRMSL